MNGNSPLISLVTTCKGRLSYLRESLKTWLVLDYDNYEIVIVDYDCPDYTSEFIKENKSRFLKKSTVSEISVVQIKNKPIFNLSDARNKGVDTAGSELILMIDADVKIKDKGILKWMSNQYDDNIRFFSNIILLNTNFIEGHLFYKMKYGIESIKYHSLLPLHSRIIGLSGTAGFKKEIYQKCGKYRPEINESGWGSDDIEFYIRYLNYLYGRKKSFNYPKNPLDTVSALDEVLIYSRKFLKGTFDLMENTAQEKSKFYPLKKNESTLINQDFIRLLLTQSDNPWGWSERENKPFNRLKSIYTDQGCKKYNLPEYFREFYNFWIGRAFFNQGLNKESEKAFKEVIAVDSTRQLYKLQSFLFIARLKKESLDRTWEEYYKKGIKILEDFQMDKETMEILDKYNLASLLKFFGHFKESFKMFEDLTRETDDVKMMSGTNFHLGELAFQKKNYHASKTYFKQTLLYNSDHRRAQEYLKKINEI